MLMVITVIFKLLLMKFMWCVFWSIFPHMHRILAYIFRQNCGHVLQYYDNLLHPVLVGTSCVDCIASMSQKCDWWGNEPPVSIRCVQYEELSEAAIYSIIHTAWEEYLAWCTSSRRQDQTSGPFSSIFRVDKTARLSYAGHWQCWL